MSSLHRLQSLAMVLSPATTVQMTPSFVDLTLDQALELVSAAQRLVKILQDAGANNRFNPKMMPTPAGPTSSIDISAELMQTLSSALSELASDIGAVLRQQQARRIHGLYVIIDPQVTGGRDPLDIARAAIRGGASMLQLRDKLRDKGQVLPLARALQQLCQSNDVLLIINDHADLAAVVGSGGLHVGQTDMPVAQARQVLGPQQVLGRSNREIQQLIESQEMGADHVAFGSIYPTTTKGVGRPPQGVEQLRRAREVTRVPLVAIGGINADNVAPVVAAGADAICVTAAVGAAPEPEAAASRLVAAIRAAGGQV
jgi:thiamine-phosphate diphosphorylase